jgi:hypothetical protein
MSFLRSFFGLNEDSKEQPVCCPFEHSTPSGMAYLEHHPSAHVNLLDGLFHCKACGTGHSEATFIKAMLGTTPASTARLAALFAKNEEGYEWRQEAPLPETVQAKALEYGISIEVMNELELKSSDGKTLSFPVFMYDKLLDVRNYNRSETPKCKSRVGAMAGLILPYDLWRNTPKTRTGEEKWTILCAGEKDMAVARSNGLNAITLTGGEGMRPQTPLAFKGRRVAIVYDNDGPGLDGGRKMANLLTPIAKEVRLVTGFHEICKENKEDITDFFTKYGKTRDDLVRYINDTPQYVVPPESQAYPMMNLRSAAEPKNVDRMLRANIQVVATVESAFRIPTAYMIKKYAPPTAGESMHLGEIREWMLEEKNCEQILHLMDNDFKAKDIIQHQREMVKPRLAKGEMGTELTDLSHETIFKAVVTDMFETSTDETMPMEYTAYSIGQRLESGKKYLATFKLVEHPYHGATLVMIITGATDANDSVTTFRLTEENKDQLDVFRALAGTPAERMKELAERFKGILGYNGNNTLIETMDLAFHTPLHFNFGRYKNVRAYLDTIIVGESRMGKSSTADKMRLTYALGVFTSLAGNAATIPGLTGGTNKTTSGNQTKAGLIPQNHKGLIIFEEFGKSKAGVTQELTDIRSSNEVRITRVSGTLTLPAVVRMISLTNPKTTDGNSKPIASYPNGIAIITELVSTAEDIARYDLMLVLGDRGNKHIDPLWEPKEPLPTEAYRTRIRWVWSRTADQIVIEKPACEHLITEANKLNDEFDCHIKVFGTEAWKKILRMAIACAGCLVSTDDTHENIIVKKEHIDFAVDFMLHIYDNGTFRLREYVVHERKYSHIDDEGIALLQEMFIKCPSMLLHLEQVASTTKNTLQAATGLENAEYNAVMNRLISGMFVIFTKFEIVPTERFRLGITRINRNVRARRIGEP